MVTVSPCPGNRNCANCIGALSFPIAIDTDIDIDYRCVQNSGSIHCTSVQFSSCDVNEAQAIDEKRLMSGVSWVHHTLTSRSLALRDKCPPPSPGTSATRTPLNIAHIMNPWT